MAKDLFFFLFTDWHQVHGRRIDDWMPFGVNTPPDTHTIQAIKDEVNRRLENILATDFPLEEKMEFNYLNVGPEVIESKAEPKWEKVWGAIVDRAAATTAGNSEKLRKMAIRLAKSKEDAAGRGKHAAALFVTPKGNTKTLQPLSRYQQSFEIYHASEYLELVLVIAGWVAATTQRVDSEQVSNHIDRIY